MTSNSVSFLPLVTYPHPHPPFATTTTISVIKGASEKRFFMASVTSFFFMVTNWRRHSDVQRQRSVLNKAPHHLNGPHRLSSNSLWPQFHHAPSLLFRSRASAVMGCDGCLRAALCAKKTRCGLKFGQIMRRETRESPATSASPPPTTPPRPVAFSSPILIHNLTFSLCTSSHMSLPSHVLILPSRGMLPRGPPPSPPPYLPSTLAFPCWVIIEGIERVGVTSKEVK